MLVHLIVKNIALIEKASIDFEAGLNILSGETGAGKSMIIDSINFVSGERAQKNMIRTGAEKAEVTAFFQIKDSNTVSLISDMGIEVEDGQLLLYRSLSQNGKTACRVNGSAVTIGILRQISENIIDIHGQHQHQSLLNPQKHIQLLDMFCQNELEKEKKLLAEEFKAYKALIKSMKQIAVSARQKEHRIDLLRFQVAEIEQACLQENEEEILLEQRTAASYSDKINRLGQKIKELLSGDNSIGDKISEAKGYIDELNEIDSFWGHLSDALEECYAAVDDASFEIRKRLSEMDANPKELDVIENRLNLIYQLKRKYGSSVKEILDYYENIRQELEQILNSEEKLENLRIEKKRHEKTIVSICTKMSQIRKKQALEIERKIESELADLGMKNSRFNILLEKRNEFNTNGWDRCEFLIAANPEGELMPLAKIASGGEMSRVMLALKTILLQADFIETFIFDEIDTGVSGRTAQKVAQKLSNIGKTHQVICITHLPQIASMADAHFLIEKRTDTQKTSTNIYSLNFQLSVMELARLIGGAKITETTLTAASEMKELAQRWKEI